MHSRRWCSGCQCMSLGGGELTCVVHGVLDGLGSRRRSVGSLVIGGNDEQRMVDGILKLVTIKGGQCFHQLITSFHDVCIRQSPLMERVMRKDITRKRKLGGRGAFKEMQWAGGKHGRDWNKVWKGTVNKWRNVTVIRGCQVELVDAGKHGLDGQCWLRLAVAG